MVSEATVPRSRMEKLLWASSVWMKVSTKARLCSSCPKRRRAFSTLGGVCEGHGVSESGVAPQGMRSGQARAGDSHPVP